MADGNVLKCCFTGYRPQKFGFRLSGDDINYVRFENALTEWIMKLINEDCRIFYTGMAMGFDIIAAENVALLKKARPELGIKIICVVPFLGQEKGFNDFWQKKYNNIMSQSDEQIQLSDNYYSGCYQVRNKFMVDNCDCVLTWYDGKPGGTRNTLNYALKQGRQVFNINGECESIAFQTVFEII